MRNGSWLIFLSRQLLTDCILGESEKEKKKKAALPNPRVFHTETLLHTQPFAVSKGALNQMHEKTVETADLSAYICTCQQFRGEHTYANIQSTMYNPLGGYFCSYIKSVTAHHFIW